MSTNSTIRIKLGAIEVECTATEDFLKAELPVLMQSMVEMHRAQFPLGANPPASDESGDGETGNGENNASAKTTRTLAAALTVKSCSDLVLAA